MPTFDLSISSLREFNNALHAVEQGDNDIHFEVLNPRGRHAVAVGIASRVTVKIEGSVGYYCAGMNDGGRYRHPRLGRPWRSREHDVGDGHR